MRACLAASTNHHDARGTGVADGVIGVKHVLGGGAGGHEGDAAATGEK